MPRSSYGSVSDHLPLHEQESSVALSQRFPLVKIVLSLALVCVSIAVVSVASLSADDLYLYEEHPDILLSLYNQAGEDESVLSYASPVHPRMQQLDAPPPPTATAALAGPVGATTPAGGGAVAAAVVGGSTAPAESTPPGGTTMEIGCGGCGVALAEFTFPETPTDRPLATLPPTQPSTAAVVAGSGTVAGSESAVAAPIGATSAAAVAGSAATVQPEVGGTSAGVIGTTAAVTAAVAATTTEPETSTPPPPTTTILGGVAQPTPAAMQGVRGKMLADIGDLE